MPLPMRDFNQCRGGKPVKRGEGVAGFGGALVVIAQRPIHGGGPGGGRSKPSGSSASGSRLTTSRDSNQARRDLLKNYSPVSSTAMKAFWGMLTEPMDFIFCLPRFWASRSLRLRLTSPP